MELCVWRQCQCLRSLVSKSSFFTYMDKSFTKAWPPGMLGSMCVCVCMYVFVCVHYLLAGTDLAGHCGSLGQRDILQ